MLLLLLEFDSVLVAVELALIEASIGGSIFIKRSMRPLVRCITTSYFWNWKRNNQQKSGNSGLEVMGGDSHQEVVGSTPGTEWTLFTLYCCKKCFREKDQKLMKKRPTKKIALDPSHCVTVDGWGEKWHLHQERI